MSNSLLHPGDDAPDFTLQSTEGESVNLYATLTQSSVVLFFYVMAFTPLCTAEVCSFRDHAGDFRAANATIFGIGSEPEGVSARFASYNQLPYPLLADPGGRVRKLYRVPKLLGFVPGRVTYVIGQNRKIVQAMNAASKGREHALNSLDWLRGNVIDS